MTNSFFIPAVKRQICLGLSNHSLGTMQWVSAVDLAVVRFDRCWCSVLTRGKVTDFFVSCLLAWLHRPKPIFCAALRPLHNFYLLLADCHSQTTSRHVYTHSIEYRQHACPFINV